MLILPIAPGSPAQRSLFEIAPASDLSDLITLACDLAAFEPALLDLIVGDLDAHALAKKQKRLDHQRWADAQTAGLVAVPPTGRAAPRIGCGRPRMRPLCALVFLLLRGWLGGAKDEPLRNALRESISLRIFLANLGQDRVPAPSTIAENLGAITAETRARIHRAELAMALSEGLDDFAMARIDSTDARSASAYPTDSITIAKLALRMCSRLDPEKLARLGCGPAVPTEALTGWQGELAKLNYRISTLTSSSAKQAEIAARKEEEDGASAATQPADDEAYVGKRESAKARLRRELYVELYTQVETPLPEIEAAFQRVRSGLHGAPRDAQPPARQQHREQLVSEFEADLESTRHAITQSRRRVCEGKRPSVATGIPLGISDPGASFIEKGSWERTFGYRPQIAFSGSNLVTALIVPEGNASDQSQLAPTVAEVITNTRVVPGVVSIDDGYTGKERLAETEALGIAVVSFSGARGKALLGEEKWESEEYRAARLARNGAESGIYVLKKRVGFEQLAAFGQERVRDEQLEKVLAYNALKDSKPAPGPAGGGGKTQAKPAGTRSLSRLR